MTEKEQELRTLEANIYHYQLEAKNNTSDALIDLSGLIISMTKDIRSYETKHGKNDKSNERWVIITTLNKISDVFYPIWQQLDNCRSLLKESNRIIIGLKNENKKLKDQLDAINKSFQEL